MKNLAHDINAGAKAASGSKCPFARLMGREPASLADTLREKTKDAHSRAERHPMQARMVQGCVTRGEYAAWLVQMLAMWRSLDAALKSLAGKDERLGAMLRPYHVHAHRIEEDLAHMGFAHDAAGVQPTAAAFASAVRDAGERGHVGVIGAWYVLEGSTNGGRFIAKALSRSLDLPGTKGLTSFDPHGEQQRPRWQAWRADLDAQAWTESERDAIVATASATFDAIYDLMEELAPSADAANA